MWYRLMLLMPLSAMYRANGTVRSYLHVQKEQACWEMQPTKHCVTHHVSSHPALPQVAHAAMLQ